MADDDDGNQVEQTIEQLVSLHEEHQQRVIPTRTLANGVTAALGAPGAPAVIFLLMAGRWAGT